MRIIEITKLFKLPKEIKRVKNNQNLTIKQMNARRNFRKHTAMRQTSFAQIPPSAELPIAVKALSEMPEPTIEKSFKVSYNMGRVRRWKKMLNKRNEKNKTEKEIEYEEMRKLGEQAGIVDLMSLYGEYQKWMRISMQYLKEMDVKFTFSTTDSTS